jgi:RNA polymerase sigma factor (sigma-70 family)
MQTLSEPARLLAARYMPLARKLALPFQESYPEIAEDLESAGLVALVECAGRFDAQRNVKFATYARPRIEGAIKNEARAWLCRKRHERQTVIETERADPGLEQLEQSQEIDRLIEGFKPQFRSLIRKSFLERIPVRELAADMHVGQATICRWIQEALATWSATRSATCLC